MKSSFNLITSEGYRKLVKKLNYLQNVTRREAIDKIKSAKNHGDLSENSEYSAAKEYFAMIESEINNLQSKLSNIKIVDNSDKRSHGKIIFGSKVKIVCVEDKKEKEILIVGEYEADWKKNKISIKSPIAQSIMGKHVNDVISIMLPQGRKTYRIISIC